MINFSSVALFVTINEPFFARKLEYELWIAQKYMNKKLFTNKLWLTKSNFFINLFLCLKKFHDIFLEKINAY